MWFFPVWGVVVWLAATIVVRVSGHYYLHPDHPYLSALAFLLTVPLVGLVTVPVYDWQRVSLLDRPTAAILLCLPGLVLDALVLLLFARVYPNLEGGETVFAAWLVWAYALVLVSGLLSYTRMWRI